MQAGLPKWSERNVAHEELLRRERAELAKYGYVCRGPAPLSERSDLVGHWAASMQSSPAQNLLWSQTVKAIGHTKQLHLHLGALSRLEGKGLMHQPGCTTQNPLLQVRRHQATHVPTLTTTGRPAKTIQHSLYTDTALSRLERQLFYPTHRNKHRKSDKIGMGEYAPNEGIRKNWEKTLMKQIKTLMIKNSKKLS